MSSSAAQPDEPKPGVSGASAAASPPSAATAAETAPPPQTQPETAAQTAIDPICGMSVNKAAPKGGSFAYAGTTYYFCNPRCLAKFSADPEHYLKSPPPPRPAAKPTPAAAT
ncbi:MAG TPA: YHS domain-containing protein, partial [Pseudomonadota bacterium]|nr:YHS domain-containing protein [Pseudomonadota bacterium]